MAVLDFDLDTLKTSVKFVDDQLSRLEDDIESCVDPDGFGIYERIEHILGIGFVSCQHYITATCSIIGISKKDACVFGPTHRCELHIARILNESANYWKHSSEWKSNNNGGRYTREVLTKLIGSIDQDYVLSCAFNELLLPFPLRFARIVPFLVSWRDELLQNYGTGKYITLGGYP